MLSRLSNIFAGTSKPSYPSVVLVLEISTTKYVLHITPEDGAVERLDHMRPTVTAFYYGDTKERSREQLGTVLLHVGDGETPSEFLDDISAQVTQFLGARQKGGAESGADTIDQALRFAALDNLRKREKREPPVNAAQLYPIFLVQVDRSKPGKINAVFEPTSISRW